MKIPDQLHCLFSASVEQQDDRYVVEIPKQELKRGDVRAGDAYRIAILESSTRDTVTDTDIREDWPQDQSDAPVEVGETRRVEIEDLGEQGDGLTRVERGFVVIVPDTDPGERVVIEITDVTDTVAFAEVTERISYYD